MKKLFLSICFSGAVLYAGAAVARTIAFDNLEEAKSFQQQQTKLPPAEEKLPNPYDPKQVDDFIIDRLQNVTLDILDDKDDPNKSSSMNMQQSDEYIARMQEENKSFFEKIYDRAMKRISEPGSNSRSDQAGSGVRYIELKKDEIKKFNMPDFPVLNVELPNGQKTMVPAREHIPYLSAQIDILPSGLVNIHDTVIVVANGQKLKNGLSRVIPKEIMDRSGKTHKIELNLVNVTINDREIPHHIIEQSDSYVIVPDDDYEMTPGVYSYDFNYLVDRQLTENGDYKDFYWDVTGSRWNLIIGKAVASIRIPGFLPPARQDALLGYTDILTPAGVVTDRDDIHNTVGFVTTSPMFIAEGMHLLISIPQENFEAIPLSRRFIWFLNDYGDILFSLLGLAAIMISYYLSWKYISRGAQSKNANIKKSAALIRYLAIGIYDKVSFAAFLLELYRKNIIDIQHSDKDILLVKRTDNLASLDKYEKKALSELFPNKEAVLNASSANLLKVKRAASIIQKQTVSKMKQLALKLNFGYLLFSSGMLLLTITAASLLHVNSLQAFEVLFAGAITTAFYLWVLRTKFRSKLLGYAGKITAVIFILLSILIMSVYVHLLTAVLLFVMIYGIFVYTMIFAKRSGLIKANVKDAQNYRDYLIRNAQTISLGRDFLNQQAYILALDTSDHFPSAPNIKDYYKLDLIREMLDELKF